MVNITHFKTHYTNQQFLCEQNLDRYSIKSNHYEAILVSSYLEQTGLDKK